MLKKILNYIKKYGIINVVIFIIKKIKNKIYLKKLEKECQKNNSKMNFNFLNNYKTDLNFYFNLENKNKINVFYEKNLELKKNIIKDSEKILNHIFSFLSDKEYNLGRDIKWNQDFKSNFIWENEFYKKIKIVDIDNDADVKVPWELSRFQHIFTLGKAYWLTEDKKYYFEFRNQLFDWIEKNPVYMSVNWTCAMDVAIRGVNLIFGYFLFKDLIDKDSDFLKIFNNSLYNHGKYIFNNLEKGLDYANNHYLSDLNGLVFIGLYFKKLKSKEINKWLKFGIEELEKEMMIENNSDGTNYETSTSYHRLVTELMFYPMYLCELNDVKFTIKYRNRLEKMFEFMAKITKSNGKIPLIGDVDNGRLVILSNYYSWNIDDCRNLISLGGKYFNNNFLKEVASKEIEDKVWILNDDNYYKEKFNYESVEFRDGGYYLLNNKNIYCLIKCGELSIKGQGGHSHNDQLSFELNVLGEDFIKDTGTGVYTANKEIRNLFRSTIMHNTVSIKGIEQNNFNTRELFSMPEESFSKCLKFSDGYFEGEHYGYLKKINTIHNRKIKLDENNIEILDSLENTQGIVSLNLDPNVTIETKDKLIILSKNNKIILLKLENNNYRIEESVISRKYGEIIKNKRIEVDFKNENRLTIEIGDKNGN